MNDHYLISDEWVAIRPDPIKTKGHDKAKNDDSSVDVSWDNEKHLIELTLIIMKNDDSSKTASHTVNSVVSNHWQLKELFPQVDVDLPEVPMEPRGIWSYWSSWKVPMNFEESLKTYLMNIKNIIGEQLFLQTYFESQSDEEYLENLNELNREVLLKNLHSAKALLEEVRSLRGSSINFLDTLSIYDLEDEAQSQVDVEEAILYNFEQQPFLELREVARQKYTSLQKQLLKLPINDGDVNDVGPDKLRISELCLECQKELKHYETCLSDLQINYFEKLFASLESCCDLMVDDQKKYGDDFENSSGKIRYNRKQKELSEVSVQLLRLKKLKLLMKRESIKGEVCQLTEGEHIESDLNALEKKFYRTQMNIFEVRMKILAEEEKIYRAQLKEFHFLDDNNNKNKSDINSQRILNDGERCSPSYCLEKDDQNPESENDEDFHDAVEEQIKEKDEGKNADQMDDDSGKADTEITDEMDDDSEKENEVNRESANSKLDEELSDIINQFLCAVTPSDTVTDNVVMEIESHAQCEISEEDWKRKQAIIQLLNRTFRKRAWLRNKQRKFVSIWKDKVDVKKKIEENYNRHHVIHLRREKQKADMEKKKEFLQEERRRTITRLKQYRKNNPEQEKRPPARYALPIRRTRNEVKTVPFRPGGPALVLPGTNMSFRMMSDPIVMNLNKNLCSKQESRNRKTNENTRKNETKELDENVNNADVVDKRIEVQQNSVEKPCTPPPPPPALPPPPPPPPPPLLTFKVQQSNPKTKKSIAFPIPPNSQQRSEKNAGIDLNSIINARSRLKKAKAGDDEGGDKKYLNDVTANMLINALNKMKKYTTESTDDEEGENDEFD